MNRRISHKEIDLHPKAEAREFAKTLYLKQYNGEIFEECQTTFGKWLRLTFKAKLQAQRPTLSPGGYL